MDDLYQELVKIANLYRLSLGLSKSTEDTKIAKRIKDKDTNTERRTRDRRRSDRKRQNKSRRGVGTHHKRRERADTSLGTIDSSDPDLTADKD